MVNTHFFSFRRLVERVETVVLLAVTCAGAAACARAPEAPGSLPTAVPAASVTPPAKPQSEVIADCAIWTTRERGPYRFENNEWGHAKARGDFEQCLLERNVDGERQFGWRWAWPGYEPTVYAYPEIVFGWKPWTGGKPTDPRFPLAIRKIKELSVEYDVETVADGHYNLAPEIWLSSSGAWSEKRNPSLLTTEIMFWLEHAGGVRPSGDIVDHPTIENVAYELWKAGSVGDRGDGRGWRLYSFRSASTMRAGTLRIHAFLKYLADAGLIDVNDFVASVEFGNEVSGGKGTTWVKRFRIDVVPSPG